MVYVIQVMLTACEQDQDGNALISQIYFWNKTVHVSDSFSVRHQEASTVRTAIGICHTGHADWLLAGSQHDIYLLLYVQC